LDIGVLGYIGIVWPKEHSPEVWSVPPVTPCIIGMCVISKLLLLLETFPVGIFLSQDRVPLLRQAALNEHQGW